MTEAVHEARELEAREGVTIMTGNGQITIPEAIREALGLQPWDEILFVLDEAHSGSATLRPVRTETDRRRAAALRRQQPLELDEARRLFMEEVAEEVMREGQSEDRP